jgi:hypothetical protein
MNLDPACQVSPRGYQGSRQDLRPFRQSSRNCKGQCQKEPLSPPFVNSSTRRPGWACRQTRAAKLGHCLHVLILLRRERLRRRQHYGDGRMEGATYSIWRESDAQQFIDPFVRQAQLRINETYEVKSYTPTGRVHRGTKMGKHVKPEFSGVIASCGNNTDVNDEGQRKEKYTYIRWGQYHQREGRGLQLYHMSTVLIRKTHAWM